MDQQQAMQYQLVPVAVDCSNTTVTAQFDYDGINDARTCDKCSNKSHSVWCYTIVTYVGRLKLEAYDHSCDDCYRAFVDKQN